MIIINKHLRLVIIALTLFFIPWLMAVAAVYIEVKEPFGCRQTASVQPGDLNAARQIYVVDTCAKELDISDGSTIVIARAWRKDVPDNFMYNFGEVFFLQYGSSNRHYEVGPYQETVRKCAYYDKDKAITTGGCDYFNYSFYGVVVDEAYVQSWYEKIINRLWDEIFIIAVLFPLPIVVFGIILIILIIWKNFKKTDRFK